MINIYALSILGRSDATQQLTNYSNIEPEPELEQGSEWSKWQIQKPVQDPDIEPEPDLDLPECFLSNTCNIDEKLHNQY